MTAKSDLRAMTRSAYDLQKLRIETGQRLCANFKAKIGQAPGDTEDELDAASQQLLRDLRLGYRRLTDGIAKNRRLPKREDFKGDELISEYAELVFVAQYFDLVAVEDQHFRNLELLLGDFPIYTEFLSTVRGVGPAMAAVMISEFDIHKARYPSSLWKYAGLDLGPDGRGRSRRAAHLVQRAYTDKDGQPAERNSITYNPWLKSKLMGVLAGLFLRTGSEYRQHYDAYKHRVSTDPAKADWNKGRINEASKRYMVKMFLCDLYNHWRRLEGLDVAPTYHEAKQGHIHHGPAGPRSEPE